MIELKLQEFGFEKIYGEAEQDADQTVEQADWHYYVYQIADGLALVSNASTTVVEANDWFVDVYNTYPTIRITDPAKLSTLINLLKTSIIYDTDLAVDEPITESVDEL
jgi:hypothetical protein